ARSEPVRRARSEDVRHVTRGHRQARRPRRIRARPLARGPVRRARSADVRDVTADDRLHMWRSQRDTTLASYLPALAAKLEPVKEYERSTDRSVRVGGWPSARC